MHVQKAWGSVWGREWRFTWCKHWTWNKHECIQRHIYSLSSRTFFSAKRALKEHPIVINACLSNPSLIVFPPSASLCCRLAAMPAVSTTGTVLSGTVTTSTCHSSCTVPVYPAGSVTALHTLLNSLFLNCLFPQTRWAANNCGGFIGEVLRKHLLRTPLYSATAGAEQGCC